MSVCVCVYLCVCVCVSVCVCECEQCKVHRFAQLTWTEKCVRIDE